MKIVSTLLSAALTGLVAACTVTTGGGFDEDDDLMFGEKPRWDTDDDETSDTGETSDGSDSDAAAPDDTSTDETSTDPGTGAQEPDAGTDTTDTTDETTEPDAGGGGGMCALELVEDDCDTCLIYSCIEQVEACCDSDCAGQWPTVKSCMQEEPDPLMTREDQLEECTLEAASDEQDGSLDSALFDLRNCIEASFEGDWEDDPFERQPGDGTCTYACYGTFVIGD